MVAITMTLFVYAPCHMPKSVFLHNLRLRIVQLIFSRSNDVDEIGVCKLL
jgi:hypothetical protein